MHHSLIGPLRQQWSDRIVSSINDQEYWWGICFAKVEKLILLGHLVSCFRSQLLRKKTVLLKPYQGFLLQRQEQGNNAFCGSLKRVLVPKIRARAPDPLIELKRHKVRVYDEEIRKILLHCLDDFMVIGFRQPLQRRLLYDVAKV